MRVFQNKVRLVRVGRAAGGLWVVLFECQTKHVGCCSVALNFTLAVPQTADLLPL